MIVTLTLLGLTWWFAYVALKVYAELHGRNARSKHDTWRWQECSHGIEHLVCVSAGETQEYAWETQTIACRTMAMWRNDRTAVPCFVVYVGEQKEEAYMVLCLQ